MTGKEQFQQWISRNDTNPNRYRVLIIALMLGLAIWGLYLGWRYPCCHYIVADTPWWRFWGYSLVNLGPELAGIVIGVVIIDALNDWRQSEQLKAQLIRQMGSPIKEVSIPAVRELAYHGWLQDGSLKWANLQNARLEGADLNGANLDGANLAEAQLMGANLVKTNLSKAMLRYANLEGAILLDAQLKETVLRYANLEGAILQGANLEGADLWATRLNWANLVRARLTDARIANAQIEGALMQHANLEGVDHLTRQHLRNADSVNGAIMPDGVKLKDPFGLEPYLDGPTLEEWLATKPDCLVWEDEEE